MHKLFTIFLYLFIYLLTDFFFWLSFYGSIYLVYLFFSPLFLPLLIYLSSHPSKLFVFLFYYGCHHFYDYYCVYLYYVLYLYLVIPIFRLLSPVSAAGTWAPLLNQAGPQTYLVGPRFCLDRPARGAPICRRYIITTVALHLRWLSTSLDHTTEPGLVNVIHSARYFSLTPYAFLFPCTGQPRRRSARTRPTTTTPLSQTVTVTQPPALATASVPRSSPPTTAASSQAPATSGTTARGIAQTTVTQSLPPAPTTQLAPPSTTAIVQPPPPPPPPGTSSNWAIGSA